MTNNSSKLEILKSEKQRLLDLYYSTKRNCNRKTDISSISNSWNEANGYWDEAFKIENQIKEIELINHK